MTYVGNSTKQVNDYLTSVINYLASVAEEIEGLKKEVQEKPLQDNNQMHQNSTDDLSAL